MNILNEKKNILVVTDGKDYSMKEVSEWLLFYSKKYSYRLIVLDTTKDKLKLVSGDINANTDLTLSIVNQGIEFKLKSIRSVFIRQTRIIIDSHQEIQSNRGAPTNISSRLYNYLMAYEITLRWFLLNCLSEINIIGYDAGSTINKLEVLKMADQVGLSIPSSILTTKKTDLYDFFEGTDELIVKSLATGLSFYDLETNMQFNGLTNVLNKRDLSRIPDEFQLSLIQKRITKIFEIRVFYLDGNCYSFALLSQNNLNTSVDYRNYDWDNPMRVVSYELPKRISKKIINLMEKLQLR